MISMFYYEKNLYTGNGGIRTRVDEGIKNKKIFKMIKSFLSFVSFN